MFFSFDHGARKAGPPTRPLNVRDARKRFAADENGAAALEFGLVAAPFFLLMFSTMEVGMLFFTTSAVESGLSDAARMIRTGEVQAAEMEKADFVNIICGGLSIAGDCPSRVTVDVRNFGSFGGVAAPDMGCSDSEADPTSFDPGAAGEIVLVRVCYRYQTITPGIGAMLGTLENGDTAIVSSFVFRNEPFDDILPTI
ncbi:MAG: pilus assembly protein [Parvularculaceae bacterium]